MTAFYGKYRGKVAQNMDPLQIGRVQVSVPAVFGDGQLSWAMPCAPYAGSGVGFFAIPPVGANVWVEFEAGDTDHPIWSGCFWGSGEPPAQLPQMKVLKTDGIKLELSDVPGGGGFTLEVGSPAVAVPVTVKCDASGIELSHGSSKIKLSPATVSINDGALEVM
jgi:hypothetical protein